MRRRGFTLIELLVVVAICAILAAILFPVFARARAMAIKKEAERNGTRVESRAPSEMERKTVEVAAQTTIEKKAEVTTKRREAGKYFVEFDGADEWYECSVLVYERLEVGKAYVFTIESSSGRGRITDARY